MGDKKENGGKKADCSAAGVIPDPDNENACIPDPDYVDPAAASKEKTDKARALLKAINTGGDPITSAITSSQMVDSIPFKKGSAKGSIAGWNGTEYAGETGTGDAKRTSSGIIYSNEEMAKDVRWDSAAGSALVSELDTGNAEDGYTVASEFIDSEVGGPWQGGNTEYDDNDKIEGTYRGASVTYECTGDDCRSIKTSGGVNLTGSWKLTPSSTATLKDKDDQYLSFGWWASSGTNGMAGAIHFPTGLADTAADDTLSAVSDVAAEALNGTSAKYKGGAAGQFAFVPRRTPSEHDSGYFTANAELDAVFGAGEDAKISGTIDGFTLNGATSMPTWKVMLMQNDVDGTSVNQTKWHIDDAEGDAFGTSAATGWTANWYEEGDGNNTPDSVLGTFGSRFGTEGSMVGAFGAEKE